MSSSKKTANSPAKNLQEKLREAMALHQSGQLNNAEKIYRHILKKSPNNITALHQSGILAASSEKYSSALKLLKKAIRLAPENSEIYYSLALTHKMSGDIMAAILNYQAALNHEPNFYQAHFNLGNIYRDQGHFEKAKASYLNAIKSKPDYILAHFNLGTLNKDYENFEEAIFHFKQTLKFDSQHIFSLAYIADIFERLNNLDSAQDYINKALELDENHAFSNQVFATLSRRKGNHKAALERLSKITLPKNDPVFIQHINFELGKLYDLNHDSDNAFKHFTYGNKLQSDRTSKEAADKNKYLSGVNMLHKTFTQEWVQSWTKTTEIKSKNSPTFLIGFPRSGTTLLDQILDSHPKLQVVEEKPALNRALESMKSLPTSYPETLSTLNDNDIRQYQKKYFNEIYTHITRSRDIHIIDKYPLNIIHCGLIQRIFPEAKFILALRHPCDVCLSCFMQLFTANDAMNNFHTLEDTINLYDKTMSLWERYTRLLPLNTHIIKYENLVDDFSSEVKKLLAFLDVNWDDKLISFNEHAKSRDIIRTPSYNQVTQPLYQHSKFRWERYKQYFKPHMHKLEPWISKLGY